MIKAPGYAYQYNFVAQGISLIGNLMGAIFRNNQAMVIIGILTAVWIIVWLTRLLITRR